LPAKVSVTGIGPWGWPVTLMTQDAAPVDVETALQVCAVAPLPRVNVTGCPPRPAPVSVVRTPETVNGCPFWVVVPPL
jgi:hypothetical protein